MAKAKGTHDTSSHYEHWLDNPANHMFVTKQRDSVQKKVKIGTRIYKRFIVIDTYPNFVLAVHEESGYTESFRYFDLEKYDIKGRYPYGQGHQSYTADHADARRDWAPPGGY